jgi:zinc/manganese transport system permease protein
VSGALSFEWSILAAPLAAGLLVTATHVVLGRRVLERGIIFIDLTLAQVAALGGILASAVGLPDEGWIARVAAGAAAFAAAGLLAWSERKLPQVQEALIGCLYVVAASLAILLVAHNPHGAEHFEEMLSGQILWVNYDDLADVAIVYALLLAVWGLWAHANALAFYFLFALAVMVSVHLVGVFLVFATLILPALAAHGLDARRGLALGYAVGAGGYLLGLWLSVPLDLPAGPLVVCTLAALALLTAVVRWARA